MSFNLSVTGEDLPVDLNALKSLKGDLNLAFSLDSTWTKLLDTPLNRVPPAASESSVTYTSPAVSWCPANGSVQFGLLGGATGALAIVTSGDLVGYTDGLTSPRQESVSVPPNTAYLKLTLCFTISGKASGRYTGGAYGVTAGADAMATCAIAFCKEFPPSALLRTALVQTFESLVLPLHEDTLALMSDGDYLLYTFDGNLHLSFGAYAGLDQTLYAGQSTSDVLKTFGSPLATISANTRPQITADTQLDFACQYATRFEALLSKLSGTARLQLFRASSSVRTTSVKAGLKFNANTSASITSHAQAVQDSLINAAGGAGSPGGAALEKVLSSVHAVSEVDRYLHEVNQRLTGWLNQANGLQSNLQLAIETSGSRTLLAAYDFDLTSPAFPTAWHAAVDCDFVKALQTGAVTLDAGSGLERAYQSKTAFSCNFFHLWSLSAWSQFASDVCLVYAGNNVFHLIAEVGRKVQTDSIGAMDSMNIYFSARSDVAPSSQTSLAHIDLHIDLTSQGDPKATARLATILSALEGGPVCDELARNMHAFGINARSGTAQLQVTIPSSAYSLINCDEYDGGKPLTPSNYNDSLNWTAFARAADDLNAWPLRHMATVGIQQLQFLKTFFAWENLNEAANGSSTPDRLRSGNAYNIWPAGFPDIDEGSRAMVVYSMLAGQSFMNFCAALRSLANASRVNSAGMSWNNLVKLMTDAIKQDLGVDFLRPAALATMRLCGSNPTSVSGPDSGAVTSDHFAVSLTL